MEFMLGPPLAMLAFLAAPIFVARHGQLWIVAGVGAMIPAVLVLLSRFRGAAPTGDDAVAGDEHLVEFSEFFLIFFVFAVLMRALGLGLQKLGWPRWKTLLVDVVALAPAIGFFGALLAGALKTAA